MIRAVEDASPYMFCINQCLLKGKAVELCETDEVFISFLFYACRFPPHPPQAVPLPLEGKACAKLCYNSHSIQIYFTIIPHFFQRLFFFKIKSGCVQGDFLNQAAHGLLLSFITSLFQAFLPLYRPRRVHNANTDAFCNIPAYARSAPTTPQQHDVPTADGSSLSRFFA